MVKDTKQCVRPASVPQVRRVQPCTFGSLPACGRASINRLHHLQVVQPPRMHFDRNRYSVSRLIKVLGSSRPPPATSSHRWQVASPPLWHYASAHQLILGSFAMRPNAFSAARMYRAQLRLLGSTPLIPFADMPQLWKQFMNCCSRPRIARRAQAFCDQNSYALPPLHRAVGRTLHE